MKSSETFHQFWLCSATLFQPLSSDDVERISADHFSEITSWLADFKTDLTDTKLGYAGHSIYTTPVLEDRLIEIVGKYVSPLPKRVPTLCLTHDIDYIEPTWQLLLKQFIGYRKLLSLARPNGFLDSISALLAVDQKYAGRAKSTVFLASPHPAVGVRQRLIQTIIDPSYKLDSALFLKLKDILNSFECELGIHGSFHSLTQGSLKLEKETLEKAMACEIHSVRQHWLHLPGEDPVGEILSAGLTYDSTLGWNGRPGFRGGFGRPFPLLSATGNKIWELPLVVMDGPLFFDMKLSTSEVVATATSILQEVHDRGGCVAIDWHDRAADPDYGWLEAYESILQWARERNFAFMPMSAAISSFSETRTAKIGPSHNE